MGKYRFGLRDSMPGTGHRRAEKNQWSQWVVTDMEYSYRQSGFFKPVVLQVAENGIEVFDAERKRLRSIPFAKITSLYEYDGLVALDPELGGYRSQFCTITNSAGKKLTIRNGSYLSPIGKMGEYATNQQDEFLALMTHIKTQLARIDPNLPIKTGSKIVVLVCSVVFLAGMFLCFCGLMPFVSNDDEPQSLATKLSLLIFFLCFGGGICWWSARSAFDYIPRRRPVSGDVEPIMGVDRTE